MQKQNQTFGNSKAGAASMSSWIEDDDIEESKTRSAHDSRPIDSARRSAATISTAKKKERDYINYMTFN